MTGYQVLLLGAPLFSTPQETIAVPSLKGQALLWYCAAQPGRSFPRSFLANLFWNEGGGDQRSLNTALSRLRRSLPVWPLRSGGGVLGWEPLAGVAVDTQRFESKVAAGRQAPDPAQGIALLRQAVALWRGPFLEGFYLPGHPGFDVWMEQERRAWERRVLEAFALLVGWEEERGEWDEILTAAKQALRIDALQETFHRSVMRACFRQGDRAAALAQYEVCRETLRRELGVDPDPATVALREEIVHSGTKTPVRRTGRAGTGERSGGWPGAGRAAGHDGPSPLPLVGRERILRALRLDLSAVGTGRQRVVLLQGEPGVGKTRLVEEILAGHPPGSGGAAFRTVLLGHCYEEFRDLPFAPLVEAIDGLVSHRGAVAEGLPGSWLEEVGRLVPALVGHLPVSPPVVADVGHHRHRLFAALGRFLADLPGPVLVVLEDMHWASPETVSLFTYLARFPAAAGVAFLITARSGDLPVEVQTSLHTLEREGCLQRLEVPCLSSAAIEDLAQQVLGRPDQDLSRRLYVESAGLPLFAVELLREWQERAGQRGGDLETNLPVPRTLQHMVAERLGLLPEPARNLLVAATIFPDGVAFPLLRETAGMAEEEALACLEALLRQGWLREGGKGSPDAMDREDGRLPGAIQAELRFTHDLIRRTVLGSVSRTRTQALHRQAFLLMENVCQGDGEEAVASLAVGMEMIYHAGRGGLWSQAVAWCERAAALARDRGAYPAAVQYLEKALDCLQHLPPSAERRRRTVDTCLRLANEAIYFYPARLTEWLALAREEAAALGDESLGAMVAVAEARALGFCGRYHASLDRLEAVLPYARRSGNDALLGEALQLLGRLKAVFEEPAQVIQVLEEAIPIQEGRGNFRDGVINRAYLAAAYRNQGRFADAAALLQDLVQQSQAKGDGAALAHVLSALAALKHIQGRWAEASVAAREGVRLAQTAGDRHQEYLAGILRGLPLACLGQVEQGREAQEAAIALGRQLGTSMYLGRAFAWLGEIHLLAERPEAAAAAAASGQKAAGESGAVADAALALRVAATAAAACGRMGEARHSAAEALAVCRAIGRTPEEARCHAVLAQLAATAEEREAHRRLAATMFAAMDMAWDLARLSTGPGRE